MFELVVFVAVIVSAAAAVFVLTSLVFIDSIMHQQLYGYGLQFSYDWANPYWLASKASYIMVAFILATLISMAYLYKKQWKQTQAKAGLIVEESLVYKCGACGKTITKPIKMLDFTHKPIKEINVCPYCHKILTESS